MEYEIRPLTEEEEETVEERLASFADGMAPEAPHTEEKQIVLKAEDEGGDAAGGCIVNVHAWGRAVLACLWVDERFRGQGFGSMLIRAAEDAARENGCHIMCLGTTDFQARPLYEKHGYSVFTVNKDVPRGHESWSMAKRLDSAVPPYEPGNAGAAEARFKILPGSGEDARIAQDGLGRHCGLFVPDKHGYIPLSRKLVDRDGRMVAAVIAGVDGDDCTDIDGIWVEEAYRRRGLGSYLLRETEREAEKSGAYVLLTDACDWNLGFFGKNGYKVRGERVDCPSGHSAFELEKRLGDETRKTAGGKP